MPLDLYLDTSVWGALADGEVSRLRATRSLLDRAGRGELRVVVSSLVTREIAKAPEEVRLTIEPALAKARPLRVEIGPEALNLAQEYLDAGALPKRSRDDAIHLAVASIAAVDAMVSWNFRHMVNLERKRFVHSVNVRLGHRLIDIVSPFELEMSR